MADKRAVLVQLSDNEWSALGRLSKEKDISKAAVMRQALRLYELVITRLADGEKLILEDKENKKELLML